MRRLALDIGGTKIAAARVLDDGTLDGVVQVATPSKGVWRACAELLYGLAEPASVEVLGMSAPGPLDSGSAASINIAEWRSGFGLLAAAERTFPRATVALALDGACAALAEQRFGAGRGTSGLLGVVVSTGVGGGLVLDGRIVHGRSGNAGHIGHMVVPDADELCACGATGCLETVASGPSAVRWARRHGWPGTDARQLAAAARDEDDIAMAALARAGTALGRAIASACALVDVDLAVIGGGFAAAGPALWEPMQAAATAHARLRFLDGLQVVPAELGALAALAGAGVVAISG